MLLGAIGRRVLTDAVGLIVGRLGAVGCWQCLVGSGSLLWQQMVYSGFFFQQFLFGLFIIA